MYLSKTSIIGMGTLNGIGTRFNGFSKPDEEGKVTATMWFTFFYLPVLPLSKQEFIREITPSNEFRYRVISKQPLQAKEILMTYLFGWIIIPVLWFGPCILCIREIADKIGIPPAAEKGFGVYELLMTVSIIYVVIFVWKLKDWDEARGLPENYKAILKERQKNLTSAK
jgi:hypothetical protein